MLGTGCAKCTQLVSSAQRAVDELRRGDTVEKVIDVIKVFEFAPSALPALAISALLAFAESIKMLFSSNK